jgi:hypothetical protein
VPDIGSIKTLVKISAKLKINPMPFTAFFIVPVIMFFPAPLRVYNKKQPRRMTRHQAVFPLSQSPHTFQQLPEPARKGD